jgi:uncharacterized membrane protein YbjE (DUF340 family)
MKNSLVIAGFFSAGVVLGLFSPFPEGFFEKDYSIYALYLLILLVGISLGSDPRLREIIRSVNLQILTVPLFIVLGSLAGALVYFLLFNTLSLRDTIAISFGFGYYSLSSVLITELSGEVPGVIALLANIIREIFTLLAAPLLVSWFGKLAPVMSGGATAMDTTMPVIMKYSGKDFAVIGLVSGILLTLLVPLLLSLVYSI